MRVQRGSERTQPTTTASDMGLPTERLGATRSQDGHCEFLVWAPHIKRVEVHLCDESDRLVTLSPQPCGYHTGIICDVKPDGRYMYVLDGVNERADPASRYQPEGVLGPSQVDESYHFQWQDEKWRGLQLQDYVLYELHVGTYTRDGTFDAILPHLSDLKSLGVTAVELMPIAQFPGHRNWGYDGVFPFAVQNSYGGPRGLKRLVDACHGEEMAVVLDVVYNHLGPEGNFLGNFGPYFTDRYHTPWGEAINFDGPHSDHVVRYFIENAIHWLDDFHIDALRLDAIHGIIDRNAQPFLGLLSARVDEYARRTGRQVYLIAESELNDPHFVTPRDAGGYGLHAQWNDDFHHALHGVQTRESFGYYCDFGSAEQLRAAFQDGYVLTGQYSAYRRRRHGSPARTLRPSQLVVFSQNHDQVGNRMLGERSSALLSSEALKVSAAVVLLSPYLPLLFMGEEYGETAPFLYFTDHADPGLAEAVRQGRKAEFSSFHWKGDPPDPQAKSTFLFSKLDHSLSKKDPHRVLRDFYGKLIRLRKTLPGAGQRGRRNYAARVCEPNSCLSLRRWSDREEVVMLFNFGDSSADLAHEIPTGHWSKLLDSAESTWLGPGSDVPRSFTAEDIGNLNLAARSLCVLRRT